MIKNQCKKGRLKTKVAVLNRAILLFSDDLFRKPTAFGSQPLIGITI